MNAAHLEFCASPEWRQIVEEMILPVALHDLVLGDDVLEIGPGPGFTTDVLRTKVEQLTAVELDPLLARDLGRRLAGTNVDVVRGDATALEFTDDRFTGAASFNMLHHVPSDDAQDRIFTEVARVLRPGGVFVAADGVAARTCAPSTTAIRTIPSIQKAWPSGSPPPASPVSTSACMTWAGSARRAPREH